MPMTTPTAAVTALVTLGLLSGCASDTDPPGGVAVPPPAGDGAAGTLGGLVANRDGGGGGWGSRSDTGLAGAGVAPGTVAVSWEFPGLIQTAMGTAFPTYLAHLFGKKPRHPLFFELACVTVSNARTTPLRARLRVDMPVYAQPSSQDFTVPAGKTLSGCLDPTFDLTALYALRDTAPGRVETALTDLDGGAELGTAMRSFAVTAPGDIAWTAMGATLADMVDLMAVFVTPRDAPIDQLQRLAVDESAWKDMGGLNGYERPPVPRTETLDAGQTAYTRVQLETGETLTWKLTAVWGGDGAIDVALFTRAQFEAYQAGTDTAALQIWTAQTAGMQGQASPGAGTLVLAMLNRAPDARTASWLRTPSHMEVAADALQSVFVALQKLKTKYSNIPDTFFNDWQHVRRPREVLEALSANCLDGSMLFASVLELVGMEPVLITRTGHAYVGVRAAPGSPRIWPVETTMIESATFEQAFSTALDELATDEKMDPKFRMVDVKAMRARGVAPLPQ
jgi:hypothetical protein